MTEVRQIRALVVDDEPSLLLTLAANLELAGFEVVDVSDPRVALEAVRREDFDLVLSDIKMPGMDGVQLYREIRRLDAEIPVVLMTAFALETLVEEAIQEGVYTIVAKPFDLDELIVSLGRAARRPAVLVVDGTSDGASALAADLARIGVHCRVESSAESAIEAARCGSVDVFLLDGDPASAVDLIDRIREVAPNTAFIGLEGASPSTLTHAFYDRGAFACLPRPIETASLVSMLAKARARPTLRRLSPGARQ